MKCGLTLPSAHPKASKARQRLHFPFRPERRLADTEAARAKLAAAFRRAKLQVRRFQTRTERPRRFRFNSKFHTSKEDRKILSLRNKVTDDKVLMLVRSGLSMREIAAKVGVAIPTALKRIKRLQGLG